MKKTTQTLRGLAAAAIAAAPLSLLAASAGAATPPERALRDAVAVWHLRDGRDVAGRDSALEQVGAAKTGVELRGPERDASLQRGGDGYAAELQGGYLSAGQGAGNELSLGGSDAMTMLLRLRDPQGTWDATLFSKHGGGDRLVYNLFTLDVPNNGPGMDLAFNVGTASWPGAAEVRVPLLLFDDLTQWFDVIGRYRDGTLELFVNGVKVAEDVAVGPLRAGNTEPAVIGGEPHDAQVSRPFKGQIDHAALWDRALSDEEIVALSGGSEVVSEAQRAFAARKAAVERGLLEKLKSDPYRPQYHVMPPSAWMNEPHAPVWFNDRWHLFYQYNPNGPFWGTIHWGHAVSRDLVKWEHRPPALRPEKGPDEKGVWSGAALVEGDTLYLYYTGEWKGEQCINLATSKDGVTFVKHPQNPVVPAAPEGYDTPHGFRDPFLWSEGEGATRLHYMIVGSSLGDVGGTTYLYRSRDLLSWEFLHPLHEGRKEETGVVWEMTQFWPLDAAREHWMLLANVWKAGKENPYWLGTWNRERFTPERFEPSGYFAIGEHLLSPTGAVAPDGRLLMWGIVAGPREQRVDFASGWAHCAALPREVWWREEGGVGVRPARELEGLRINERRFRATLAVMDDEQLIGVEGDTLEVIAEIDVKTAQRAGLVVRRSPDGQEQTRIYFDRATGRIEIDRTRSSLNRIGRRSSQQGRERDLGVLGGDFELGADEKLRLHLFLDRGVIEGFVNERTSLATWVYPERRDSVGIAVFAEGGDATAEVEVYELKSIW